MNQETVTRLAGQIADLVKQAEADYVEKLCALSTAMCSAIAGVPEYALPVVMRAHMSSLEETVKARHFEPAGHA